MMKRIIMAAALSLCMQVFASGCIIKENSVHSQPSAEVIDTADTPLRFKVISESAAEVIQDISYKKLKTVIIPSKVRIEGREYDVTSIGEGAFSHCSGLTGIEIPSSVTEIGSYAFSVCDGLTNITIPPSVTEIGEGAFYGCSGLTGINVSPDNPNYSSVNGVMYNKSQTETICCPGGIKGKIKLPASVTKIRSYAFWGCSGLTNIKLPSSVTEIGDGAFSDCSGLTGIEIPVSVTKIGVRAFDGCRGLTSIELPSSVTKIGYEAFYGCKNLDVIIDNSEKNLRIGSDAFNGCKSVKYLK